MKRGNKLGILFLVGGIIILALVLSGCMSPTNVVSTYSVAGCVTYNGNGLQGVTISFSDGLPSVVTNSQGDWSQSGLTGSVVVTPSLSGYTFTPSSLTVSGADNNADFTAVSVIPEVTGSWNMTMTYNGQTLSGEVLLLQNNESQVAMILPINLQGSWNEGGEGLTGQINGNQISLMLTTSGQSFSLNGTISNGLISGTVISNGQSGTFTMSDQQPIVVTQQNIDLTGTWNFVLNDQTSGYTYNFTMDTYQVDSDLINVVTSFSSSNGNAQSLQGAALFGELTGNSVTFSFNPGGEGGLQLSGTLLTTSSMSGNFTLGSDTGTWSANLVSSTYQSKKPKS